MVRPNREESASGGATFPALLVRVRIIIAEPWFLALDAAVEIHPVMAPADLAKAAPFMDEAAKKYG